ncbi:biotin--[acetyl-CoA-carboxylase] ligase [Persephonella sp.]|uniref:biotin--[acetyl-CoA-carboxylase] ligase n=1 Tax=Persephonella sp. TaxID=2060922 RepID=UPI002625782C|nr:biotin--[acetyl-CoA-carboxylase] ligase [Persephonella sp.]
MDEIDRYILEKISKNRVSGEELSKLLGISRTAIWKRIKKLESLGYKISHDKKGYFLEERTEFLLPYELNLKTQWLGENYIFFHTVNSTNTYAKENNLPDGTVILAENQTAGRGRKGRKWISTEGKGLYFSIVLKKDISPADLLIYSLLFPVAVRKAIVQKIDLPIKIKWPNDLYLNGKKLAGFLIETEIEGNTATKLIAGIGININQTEKDLGEIKDIATSLKLEYGKNINRKELFIYILQSIEEEIDNLDKNKIIKEVEKNLLWKGEKIKLIDENIEGTLIGLNELGGIRILTDKGLKDFYSGDITVRRVE